MNAGALRSFPPGSGKNGREVGRFGSSVGGAVRYAVGERPFETLKPICMHRYSVRRWQGTVSIRPLDGRMCAQLGAESQKPPFPQRDIGGFVVSTS